MKKKLLSVLLALVMVFGSMSAIAVTASAGDVPAESNSFGFGGLDFVTGADGKKAVLDLSNPNDLLIYGVTDGARLCDVLTPAAGYTFVSIDGGTDTTATLHNGSSLIISKDATTFTFRFVIYGDINDDGTVDSFDATCTELVVTGAVELPALLESVPVEKAPYIEMALDINRDGIVSVADLQQNVNVSSGNAEFDQYREDEAVANTAVTEIEPQVFDGVSLTPDAPISFNGRSLQEGVDYTIEYSNNDAEGVATVTVTGLGLYSGTMVTTFPIVDIIGKAVLKLDDVLEESGLGGAINATYDVDTNAAVLDVDSGALLAGEFSVNSATLTGLLTKIGEFFRTNFANTTDITVDGRSLYNGSAFDNTALKNTIFDLARGFFVSLSTFDDSGVVKSFSGVVTNNGTPLDFTASLTVSGSPEDIATVQRISEKLARYLSFEVVGGNAVVTVKMPAGFMNTVISVLGDGDVAAAKAAFDTFTVKDAFGVLSGIEASDITASAAEFENVLSAIVSMDGLVNKVLSKLTACTITDTAGNTYAGLSEDPFAIDRDNANYFGAIAGAVGNALSNEVLDAKTGDFYSENGVYTVNFDLTVDVSTLGLLSNGAISETIIVKLDIFDITDSINEKQFQSNQTATLSGGPAFSDLSLQNTSSLDGYTVLDANCPLLFKLDADGKVATFDPENGIIGGIEIGCTDLSSHLKAGDGYTLQVTPSAGTVISTGSKVTVTNDANPADTRDYYISVNGDVNGDGVMDAFDASVVEMQINSAVTLEASPAQAAAIVSICDDGVANFGDLTEMVNATSDAREIAQPRKLPLTAANVSDFDNVTFNGLSQAPSATVVLDGTTLTAGTDYSVEYFNNLHAGTAQVVVSGIGNYVGIVTKTFTIGKASAEASDFSFSSTLRAYTGSAKGADVSFAPALNSAVSLKYNGSDTLPVAAGIYVVTADVGGDDYNASSFTLGSLTIAPQEKAGYGIDVDNASKVITVRVTNAYTADTALISQLSGFVGSAYALKLANNAVTSVTSSTFSSRSYDVYTGQSGTNITITPTTGLLGGLLPAD